MSRGHLLDDCVRRIRNQVVSAAGSSDARDRHALAAAVERKTVGEPAVPISNPVLDEFADAMVDDPAKGDLDALRMAGFFPPAPFLLRFFPFPPSRFFWRKTRRQNGAR